MMSVLNLVERIMNDTERKAAVKKQNLAMLNEHGLTYQTTDSCHFWLIHTERKIHFWPSASSWTDNIWTKGTETGFTGLLQYLGCI
jgi:hypothetical protein